MPVYLARDVTLVNCRAVGAEKNHFSCVLADGRTTVAGIMFHCSDIESLMHTDSVVNAAFEVQIDEWRGRRIGQGYAAIDRAGAHVARALEACLNPENLSFVADLYATSDAELCATTPPRPEDVEAYEAERAREPRALGAAQPQEDPESLARGDRARHHRRRTTCMRRSARSSSIWREGRSVLGVMATGRGKSLTFHVHAAMRGPRS